MKNFLQDYGTLVGPTFAFILGLLAIYIKFYVDRQVDNWRSRKKLRKLIQLIRDSPPPAKYFPQKNLSAKLANLLCASTFLNRMTVVKPFIETIENEVLINCSTMEIRQFQFLNLQVTDLITQIESYRNKLAEDNKRDKQEILDSLADDFSKLQQSFEAIINFCDNPEKMFSYEPLKVE